MKVAEAVGRSLHAVGVTHVFGVVGSGNFHVTNAMVTAGCNFVAARHEGGAATMADACARMSGRLTVLSVHQGCGLTNAMTGIAEAAKSRTPLLVLAAEVTEPRSNFFVDQDALARAVGAIPMRVTSASDAVAQTIQAASVAMHGRRTVLLNLPLNVQDAELSGPWVPPTLPERPTPSVPTGSEIASLVSALERAERPVFIAGRGARSAEAKHAIAALAGRCGALLATSAVARGLFHDSPWALDVSGGFSSPATAELISHADLIVGWGCALNMWTMRHGRLIAPTATVAQVDDDPDALGANREVALPILGDVTATAQAALRQVGSDRQEGYRTSEVAARLAGEGSWGSSPYEDRGRDDRIDPRTLSIALDGILPKDRVLSVDSGNFMGYPSMFLSVPDEEGFCFTQAFQSIGLGLATAIGAALAQPHRLPIAALGDGGALMGAAEFETVARLGLPMVIVVYNDDAYGAEVHHFGPDRHPLDTVRFPPTDIAAIGRGYGFDAITVRGARDLEPVKEWVAGDRSRPLLVDAKIISEASWWLEEAFGGH
jgi:acetolactate synthase I/II/III large subunit